MSKKRKIFKKKGKVVKDLTRNIFKILNKDSTKSYNYKQIASQLKIISTEGKNQLIQKLAELKNERKIEEVERGSYKINIDRKYHIGTVDLTASGNGYFICDDFENDIFMPQVNVNKALQGDMVKAYVYTKRGNKKQEADIVEVLERAKDEFVGVLQKHKTFGFVIPDSRKMSTDIFVSQNKMNGAEDGDKQIGQKILKIRLVKLPKF